MTPTSVPGTAQPAVAAAAVAAGGAAGAAAVRPARALRRDAAENRNRLLAAADQVFAEHGLGAGVEQIAQLAGVGMGTLYRRFPTKDALIDALVLDVLETIIEMAQQAADQPDGTGLEHFLLAASAYQADHRGCLPRLWSTEHDRVQAARAAITHLLADAKRHGRVRDDLTGTDLTMVMWSVRGVIEATHPVAPDAWRRHLDLLTAGMRPSPEPLAHRPVSQAQLDQVLDAR